MRLFGRVRPRAGTRERALTRAVAAWCLQYPDAGTRERLPQLRTALGGSVPGPAAEGLAAVLDHLAAAGPLAAEEHYVAVFDTKPRRTLYLTWYTEGDTRRRGAELARLAALYRRHGRALAGGELPDYLPALLELAATGEPEAAREGGQELAAFRPALEALHRGLDRYGTPYAGAVEAVLATLPAKGAVGSKRSMGSAKGPAAGPGRARLGGAPDGTPDPAGASAPVELVGLEPYAVPGGPARSEEGGT